jgi:predicted peptidase
MPPGRQTPCPLPNPSGLGYYEYLPAGYGTGSFPLVVFFHGSGERGDGSPAELPRVLRHGPPKLIEHGKELPAIVISPQLPDPARWHTSITTPFVDYLLSHYGVDRSRIYVTGLSLGGEGAWMYARSHPRTVAAIVPVCGPRSGTGYSVLRDLPIWTFHADGDPAVSLASSLDILAEVTSVAPPRRPGTTSYFDGTSWTSRAGEAPPAPGENPTFTLYPGADHDAWTPAYDNQAMWSWLFAQRRPGDSSSL